MNEPNEKFFAAVGDVHGHHHEMVRLVSEWERDTGNEIAFVLQVGDFEPNRNEADLESMAAPAKYRTIGDFPDFYFGEFTFPWPLYFIGGNHEPYGFLDLAPQGAVIAPNCFYLGRVGVVEIAGLKIVGMSGIFSEDKFEDQRPALSELGTRKKKDYTYFNKDDVDGALDFGRADVLLVHDWPAGIIAEADRSLFEGQRRSIRYNSVGNEYARLLMDLLAPRLLLCGHMHKRYGNKVSLRSGTVVEVCCLASVRQEQDSVAFFRIAEDGTISPCPAL